VLEGEKRVPLIELAGVCARGNPEDREAAYEEQADEDGQGEGIHKSNPESGSGRDSAPLTACVAVMEACDTVA